MKEQREDALFSRRGILTGSAMFLVGGIAGRISNAFFGPALTPERPPPLPWKWVKLDPLEAGRRAYRSYLKNKG
jgi:hypothetical protein